MTEILRQDDRAFIGGSYRETLSLKDTDLLKTEIKFLEETQGNFARIFKKTREQAEAVFSTRQGYLLGETVWNHFNKPHNLIYCEALANGKTALLVVVRNGAVFFDDEVGLDQVAQDLITLVAPGLKYEVYLFGSVPIAEEELADHFQLKPEMLHQLTHLESSAFLNMLTLREYYLLPSAEALEEAGVSGAFSRQKIIVAGFVVAVLVLLWYLFFYHSAPKQEVVLAPTAPSAFAGYDAAMKTPAPADIILALAQEIEGVYALAGWYPLDVDASATTIQMDLTNQGGSVTNLQTWALANQLAVAISADQVSLTQALHLSPRATIPLASLWDNVARLQDRYRQFPEVQMSFAKAVSQGAYQTLDLTISFHDLTTPTLRVQANVLSGFPVTLESLQLTVANGLLSGKMLVRLYGK